MTSHRYPTDEALLTALWSVAADRLGGEPSLLGRQPSIEGTFPKEVVTVRTQAGEHRRVLVKYAAGRNHDDHGHRAGVAYESTVYRELLRPLGIERPEFLGVYTGDGPGQEWLFLEFLHGARRLSESVASESGVHRMLELAAEWLAGFHSACEAEPPRSTIRRYDERYYAGWIKRAQLTSQTLARSEPPQRQFWRRAEEVVAKSLYDPETVAHNEYYPNNVLVVDGMIYPVDWESAAIAPGELDLASLTDGWPAEVAANCVDVHRQVRWSGRCPTQHSTRLLAARVYLHCRWLVRWAERGRKSFKRLSGARGAHPGGVGRWCCTCTLCSPSGVAGTA